MFVSNKKSNFYILFYNFYRLLRKLKEFTIEKKSDLTVKIMHFKGRLLESYIITKVNKF